jgi:hypothetical protein
VSNDLRLVVVIHFLDIGGIADHQYLKFLFIVNYNNRITTRLSLKSRSDEPLLLVACLIGQLMRIIDYEYKKTIAGKKNYFSGWSFTPEID